MMQCSKCGTTKHQDNWITRQYSDSVEDETQTIIFCPQCYEEEAINAI